MINSLELYIEAINVAKNNPGVNVAPYYLQLTTMIFYELTTKKTSPLISTLCRANDITLPTKNFSFVPAQVAFDLHTSFDLYVIVYGLNVALAENLDSCLTVFESNAERIFRGVSLTNEGFQSLLMNLQALDESLIKFRHVERVIEKIVEVPTQPQEPVEDFPQSLKRLADSRRSDDERIIDEIKEVQRTLQDELPRLQETLKTISEIRDGLDFKTLEEPINQLVDLFDMINETAGRHPQEDTQKGYDKLIKRCRSFARYVEQSLAMLGAQLINETDIPFDTSRHKVTNAARPSDTAKVSKVLSVGLIYKGQILRKAEVEIVEPMMNHYAELRKSFGR